LDVFLHDLVSGQTTRVSVSSSGQQGDGDSFGSRLSANGRVVAFSSNADNLVRNDTNGTADAFVRDLKTGKTTLVSVSSTGEQGNDFNCCSKGISADGRFVAYRSFASNLVPGDTDGGPDVFLFDRSTGQTVMASVGANGEQGVYPTPDGSYNAAISEDGAWVLFGSVATNFPPGGDMNGPENGDTYVRGPFGSGSSLQARARNIIGRSNDSGASGSPQQPSTCRGLSSWDRYLPRLPAGAEATCAA